MTEVDWQRMQDEFEKSDLYFNGESPAIRDLNWKIWVAAWKAARANPRSISDLSETQRENLDMRISELARQHAMRAQDYSWKFENHRVFLFAYNLLNMRIPGDPKQEKTNG